MFFNRRRNSGHEPEDGDCCGSSCCNCQRGPTGPVGPRGCPGPMGPRGPRGATGAMGATAPSIYAQHGNCRNHAAFHYLKDN